MRRRRRTEEEADNLKLIGQEENHHSLSSFYTFLITFQDQAFMALTVAFTFTAIKWTTKPRKNFPPPHFLLVIQIKLH